MSHNDDERDTAEEAYNRATMNDETERAQAAYVEQTDPPRELADALALDLIAEMLRDPEWAPGMLEDAAVWVTATGRTTTNYDDERDTWDRH